MSSWPDTFINMCFSTRGSSVSQSLTRWFIISHTEETFALKCCSNTDAVLWFFDKKLTHFLPDSLNWLSKLRISKAFWNCIHLCFTVKTLKINQVSKCFGESIRSSNTKLSQPLPVSLFNLSFVTSSLSHVFPSRLVSPSQRYGQSADCQRS